MVSGRKQVTIIGVITGLIFFSLLVFSTNSAAEEPASDAASVTRSNEAAIDQETILAGPADELVGQPVQ